MSLQPEDYDFIRRERRLVSSWPLVGGGALFVLLVFYAWLSFAYPQIANPAYVYKQIKDNNLPQDVIAVLAFMAPLLLTTIFAIVGIMLGYVFSFMRKEKQLLDIIDRKIN